MAVPEQTPYIEHTGNGVTTSFALEFQCESKDHLIVLVDEIEPPIASWSLFDGNVVFTTAPASGSKITLQRNTPFSRTTDYQSYNNSFRPPAVNKDFDWIWLKLQELGVADWILSNRIDALKNYVDRKDDELRAYLMEEIRKQGVALDQLDEYYNYLMQRLAQIAVDKGWDASFVVDASGKNQQQINNEFNTLSLEFSALNLSRKAVNYSVYLVDYLSKPDFNLWVANNESIDMTAAFEAAMADLKTYLPRSGTGIGEIILPKGIVLLNTRQLYFANTFGLKVTGQGLYTTIIKTYLTSGETTETDSLFRFYSYMHLQFTGITFMCMNQTLNLFRLNGAGGGRKFLLNNCQTIDFKHIATYENNINEDTNFFLNCEFGRCVSIIYARNNQALINTFLHCSFGEYIDKVFDITGFGYTTVISGNVVTGGKFYHLASASGTYFGQTLVMINTKFEYGNTGKQQILSTENNPNNYLFAKLINCALVGNAPDATTYPFDVSGKVKIEIDGGQWPDAKMRVGQTGDFNACIDIRNCSQPVKPENISWLQYQSGFAYSYIPVKFSNNYGIMDYIVRNELCHATGMNVVNTRSSRGAVLIQGGATTPTTHPFILGNGPCYVNSLKLIIKRWSNITNLRVSVFSDAAYAIPMNTEQVIALSGTSGSTPISVDIPLTVSNFTGTMYVRVVNDNLSGVVYGHFKLDTDFI